MKLTARQRLLASTLLVGFAASASPAFAQQTEAPAAPGSQTTQSQAVTPSVQVGDNASRVCDQNPNAPDCAAGGEAIVVTGSRIASPTITAASPLQVIDARDIQESGAVNIQKVLLENPAFGPPGLSRTNSNFLTTSAGIATVNLRDLGGARTLILVNGRRVVAGVPGSAIVDLNAIPSQFIERVDVLTGGASSIYGSDALAGVVNFIYKKNFEGVRITGQAGVTERGDGANYQVDMTLGHNFADGRGNIMVYAGYVKEEAIYSNNRPNLGAAIDQNACYQIANSQGGCNTEINAGNNAKLFTPYAPFYSSFVPGGTITFGSLSRVIGPGGNLILANTNGLVHNSDGVPATVRACTTADPCHPTLENATGFNRSFFRTIAVPVERYLTAFRGNYAITDHINATLEANFAKTSVTTLIEPFPFQTSGVNGTAPNACLAGVAQTICGGFHPIETRLANGTIVRNPFVPDFIYNNATDRTGDGLKDISFTRRLSDFGPRTYTADRTNFRVMAGLNGDVFNGWKWDAFYSYGQTLDNQVGSGQVNLNNFTNALEVIPGPNGPQCASAVARAQGCQPVNIFAGPNAGFSPAAVQYIQAAQTRNASVSQTVAGASLSGDLVQLWDGPVGVAMGVEYRKESSSILLDPLTQAGLNGGNAAANTVGQFDVKEAYGEVAIPLLANRPFFENLTVRAAGRVSKYSLAAVGTVYSWNLGGEYSPIKDVRFRVVEARAVRAPNIGELFSGANQTFPTGLTDPCAGVTLTSTTPASARCRQEQGVLNNIAANGSFTLNQSDIQGISGFELGNPNLKQETGDTFTAGVVINPTSFHALRNFALTVDYFNIRISDVISVNSRQFILNQCYIAADPTYCALITRRVNQEGPNSPGSLSFINRQLQNLGKLRTTGVDATLSYRQRLSEWGLGSSSGTIFAKLAYTHLIKYDNGTGGGANSVGTQGLSRDRAQGTLSYENKSWGATLRGTYIGKAYLDASFSGVNPGAPGSQDYRIAPNFTLNGQIRFTPADKYEFYIGVDNMFDKAPPPIISGIPGDNTGTETNAAVYDPIGRRFYAGARLKF